MRKLFGTDGIRGIANHYPLTPEMMVRLGQALAFLLRKNNSSPKVIIGKDTRISGYMIENSLTSGLLSMGINVLLVGPMPTPAIAHLTKSFAADAGIMISASHNPARDNGIKIFSGDGLKLSDEKELEIEQLIFNNNFKTTDIIDNFIGRAKRIDDAKGRYIEFAKASINNLSLKGIKIAIDCANGASYHIAPYIFEELGAQVSVINNKPDGLNINKNSGALFPKKVRDEVIGHYKDIGIAFDGDADRVIFIDEKGNIIDGDAILMICALYLKENNLLNKDTVVATVYSNSFLDTYLLKKGIKVKRVDCGDRYVVEKMIKENLNFGGESSGHIIFRDSSTTGDGIISALKVLSIMISKNKKLSELVKDYIPYPQVLISSEVKKKIPLDNLLESKKLIENIEKEIGSEGRVFIRYSGTENKIRVMVEANISKEKLNDYSKKIINKIIEEIDKK
jgi:phosphoglucosamine mutase